ncbi:Protein ZINC INDUCED FACILITATOR-LIKE 1 [Leucoagaricus sp. SymC.cos]|nr:Protein ZINC INDUCED FACILITATOR-LIKE 1 [Leucoagaricus sp. SymC.cos]
MADSSDSAEEQDSLIQTKRTQRTPLPFGQILPLLYLRFCDAAALYSTYPFINELLTSMAGGDSGKAAYYAGIMDTSRHASSLATVLLWSRISDYIGRKPVILMGTAAIAISALLIGMSTKFWILVASRCLYNALNHNGGTIKSALGEMTDATNRVDAFALVHAPWAIGSSIGPLIGGYFANPHIQFPNLFGGRLWQDFPYLLPCTVTFAITLLGFMTILFQFRENSASQPAPLRSLLTSRVVTTIYNYVAFALCHMAYTALQPLFLATPISVGGLELRPKQIGYVLGAYGFIDSLAQTFLLAPFIRRVALGNVFKCAVSAFVPIFLLFPLMNIYARDWAINGSPSSQALMWGLLIVQLTLLCTAEFGYGCMYIYITTAAPNSRSLGSVNGLSQTAIAVSRLIGPALATSMLGLSITKGWMNGYAVFNTCRFFPSFESRVLVPVMMTFAILYFTYALRPPTAVMHFIWYISAFSILRLLELLYNGCTSPLRDFPGSLSFNFLLENFLQMWTPRAGVYTLVSKAVKYVYMNMDLYHKPEGMAYDIRQTIGDGVLLMEDDAHKNQVNEEFDI